MPCHVGAVLSTSLPPPFCSVRDPPLRRPPQFVPRSFAGPTSLLSLLTTRGVGRIDICMRRRRLLRPPSLCPRQSPPSPPILPRPRRTGLFMTLGALSLVPSFLPPVSSERDHKSRLSEGGSWNGAHLPNRPSEVKRCESKSLSTM